LTLFLRDLLSYDECLKISHRLAAAWLLLSGKSQAETARVLKLSSKTVNAVDQWVHGPFATGGYAQVLDRLSQPQDASSGAGAASDVDPT
jgi:uncharacterized protein YerC